MVTVRLTKELEDRLDSLAVKTGRTKSFFIRQALEEHLEEVEDAYLAEKRYHTLKKTIPLDDMIISGSPL